MPAQRILSLLPSATEMVYALGLGEQLAGVTHECDYPPEAQHKQIVVRNALPVETMSEREIDAAVSERLRQGLSLYAVDEALVRDIAPNLILTQNLCQVCAPSGNEITRLLHSLPNQPNIVWMTPKSLADIDDNLRQLGSATDRLIQAENLIAAGHARLEKITATTNQLTTRPRVFCMEWIDPVYCSGHWIPEMTELAGGIDALGRKHADSQRIDWQAVLDWQPEVLVIMPCGFAVENATQHARQARTYPGWSELPAVRNGRVYVVDANAYFARPGPRLIAGVELLAHLFHPELCEWTGPTDAFCNLQNG